jgi:2-methylcitrate dehydratase
MDSLSRQLTTYTSELSYADLSSETIDQTKRIILDLVGCALGAARAEPAAIARAIALEVKARHPATLMVTGETTSPDLAAFVNGVLVRYQDYSDAYVSATGLCHPSDMFGPVLAAVESAHGGGRDLILSLALAYEIFCGITDSGAMRNASNWDQATFGVIAAVLAVSKAMGLDRERMGHALSLAASSHLTVGQVRRGALSHWKGCAVANAGRNAVFSALLAAKGMTGPDLPFEGAKGYFQATGGAIEMPPLARRGDDFRIEKARMKPFPAGYHCHTAVEAAQRIRAQLDNRIDAIKHVRMQTYRNAMNYAESVHWTPETRETADHSLPFTLAVALMEGTLAIRHYDELYYKRPDVRALMQKIEISVGEEPNNAWPESPLCLLEVETSNGEVVRARKDYHMGHYRNPMSDADQDAKLRAMGRECAGLSDARIDALIERLRHLEAVDDIAEILALTAPA